MTINHFTTDQKSFAAERRGDEYLGKLRQGSTAPCHIKTSFGAFLKLQLHNCKMCLTFGLKLKVKNTFLKNCILSAQLKIEELCGERYKPLGMFTN